MRNSASPRSRSKPSPLTDRPDMRPHAVVGRSHDAARAERLLVTEALLPGSSPRLSHHLLSKQCRIDFNLGRRIVGSAVLALVAACYPERGSSGFEACGTMAG